MCHKNNFLIIVIIIILFYNIIQSETLTNYTINNKKFQVYDQFKDYQEAGNILYELDKRVHKLLEHLEKKYIKQESVIDNNIKSRLTRLIKIYNKYGINENFPKQFLNIGKKPDSSYTINKKKMLICLRDENTFEFHNIDDIMFVVLHEIAHIISPEWNHPKLYWQIFKFLLHEAESIKIYKPTDYKYDIRKYCNTYLRSNPFFQHIECIKSIPHNC